MAYRDLHQGIVKNIETFDFTSDISSVKRFMETLETGNGKDIAEDVIGGL